MRANKALGDFGERLAARFLIEKGYVILETKYRCEYGEIDIICKNGDVTAFVEVKYRRSLAYGSPGEAVTAAKQNKIRNTALFYISKMISADGDFRFDVVEITGNGNNINTINHIENAFYG